MEPSTPAGASPSGQPGPHQPGPNPPRSGRPGRDDVVEMLATYRDRSPDEIHERIDSLEMAWLVHQVEQRYDTVLDLDDAALARMSTVTGAVDVLGEVLPDPVHD